MDEVQIGSLLASTLRGATPLILCALAGTVSERAGVIDLGLEGKMLAAAFAAGSVGAVTGSLPLALMVAIAVGVALSMLHAWGCVSQRGDQVVMGVALTMTAAGLTVVLGLAWFGLGGQTPPLADAVRLKPLMDVDPAAWPPGLRGLALALAGHNAMVYGTLVLVAAVWWMLYRTRFGLRLRATGENPAMVDAAGVSVKGMRYAALAINGVLAALAGVLPGAGAERQLQPAHDRRAGLHGAGGDDLRQVAPGGRAAGLPAVRFSRCRGHPAARGLAAADRRGAGAGHPGPALCADGGAAGRFLRPLARAGGAGPAVPEGTLMGDDVLLAAATAVRQNAHAPYSGFAVGAALRDEQGRIHVGCNVENAAYPQGLCAEAVALGALVAAGGRRITAAAVVADAPTPVTPCGGCRQKLREFASDATPVLCANTAGTTMPTTLGALLPHSFGPDHLP